MGGFSRKKANQDPKRQPAIVKALSVMAWILGLGILACINARAHAIMKLFSLTSMPATGTLVSYPYDDGGEPVSKNFIINIHKNNNNNTLASRCRAHVEYYQANPDVKHVSLMRLPAQYCSSASEDDLTGALPVPVSYAYYNPSHARYGGPQVDALRLLDIEASTWDPLCFLAFALVMVTYMRAFVTFLYR
jgi:hypothetical protein